MLKIGCIVLVVIVAIGVIYVATHKDRWLAAGVKAEEEGRAYAAGRNGNECLDESFKRVKDCSGVPCEMGVQLFLNGCLGKAARPAEACAGVPSTASISDVKAVAQWTVEECTRRGMAGSAPCSRLLTRLRTFCTDTLPKLASAPAEAAPPAAYEVPSTFTSTAAIPSPAVPPAVTTTYEPPPEPAMVKIERVWADNTTKTYYGVNCQERPENAYPIAKSLAVRQGFKPAACN